MKNGNQPFTVIFYIDGDRAVETFTEHVLAADPSDAWDVAKAQALESGASSSGYSLSEDDFEGATEIMTIAGHVRDATRESFRSDRERVAEAIQCLQRARDLFKLTDNQRTLARVRSALSSAKGAARMVDYRRERELQLRREYGAAARREGLPRDANPISMATEDSRAKRTAWFEGWDSENEPAAAAAANGTEG